MVQDPLQMHGGGNSTDPMENLWKKGINAKAVAEVTPVLFCADGNEIPFQTEIFRGQKQQEMVSSFENVIFLYKHYSLSKVNG